MTTVIMRRMMPPLDTFHRYWQEADKVLSRVYAGLVHPVDQPGFICVLGEEQERSSRIYVLAEYEDDDLGNLLRKLIEFQHDFRIQETYADITDQPFRSFLAHFNSECEARGLESIQLNRPYHFNDGKLSFHLNLLREYLRINSKRLHLLDASKLKSYLQQSFLYDETYQSHPAIAALGWPFAALISQPYTPDDRNEPQQALMDYDPFERPPD